MTPSWSARSAPGPPRPRRSAASGGTPASERTSTAGARHAGAAAMCRAHLARAETSGFAAGSSPSLRNASAFRSVAAPAPRRAAEEISATVTLLSVGISFVPGRAVPAVRRPSRAQWSSDVAADPAQPQLDLRVPEPDARHILKPRRRLAQRHRARLRARLRRSNRTRTLSPIRLRSSRSVSPTCHVQQRLAFSPPKPSSPL